ncbi:MAG: glycosyltransferase family 4 protein [Gammaproteobacteria bacterium]
MRTLHVEAGRHYYGGARQVRYLVEGLARRGVHCLLAVPGDNPMTKMPWHERVWVFPMEMRGDLDLGLVGRLKRLITEQAPDLVNVHSRRGADWLGGAAARLSGTPCVLTRRVDNPEKRWVAALKYRLFDQVVSISGAVSRAMADAGVRRPPALIRSAVDGSKVATDCDRAAFAREFDLPGNAAVLGMVAQFIPRKGHELVLDALPMVLRRDPETYVVFFGRGPLEEEVRNSASLQGLDSRVRFAGFRSDMDRLYACLDVLVHPASQEGLGVALLQAGAAGVPVVACRAGGIPEVVVHGETGLLVRPGDARGLAEAICRLVESRRLRRAMGEAARRRVETAFSVEAMVDAYLKLYGEVLGRDVSRFLRARPEAGPEAAA